MTIFSTRFLARCALLPVITIASCQTADRSPQASATPAPQQRRSSINPADFDTSASPRTDFFQYINGNWMKAHPIPPDQSAWGTFNGLREQSDQDLKAIAEELLADSSATGNRQKIRDFYATAMDAEKLAREGTRPLKPEFDRIAALANPGDLIRIAAHLHLVGARPLFAVYVSPDQKRSDRYALYLTQSGTVLPERDYYLRDDQDSRRIREAYRQHLKRMFLLLGDAQPAAAANADTVMAIETRLAEKQMTPVQLRDPEPQYNKLTVAQLTQLAPAVDWGLYFRSLGLTEVQEIIVRQPEFLQRVNQLVLQTSPTDWQTYLRWHLINCAAPRLSDGFVEENFRFFGQTLAGAKEIRPRWKRSVEAINAAMGEALGQLYVEKHFSPEAKRRINQLVDNIIAAYADRIRSRQWMSPATKEKALAKLNAIQRKLGYPDQWRDYTALSIQADHYVLNCFRAAEFDYRRRLARLGQAVDRSEWFMTPPTVNAYYSASTNEIVFPAGILQAPFFDPQADDAENYGGIGVIIGHELTHGFDDKGCKFDAAGNLSNWWTPEDKARFDARAAQLVKQYSDCVVIEDLHINGELTLGENIADLGGLSISLDAYNRSLAGKPAPVLDGLSGLQRFFINYAIVWRHHGQPESVKARLRTDPHSPPRFRVLVPLSNLPAFHKAFGVKEGDPMYRAPGDRAEVW